MTDDERSPPRFAPAQAHVYGPGGCPASVRFQEFYPVGEETDDAREAVAARWLLKKTILKEDVAADALAPNGVPINDEMREAIAEVAQDIFDTSAQHDKPGLDLLYVDQRVSAPQLIHEDFWGKPDVYLVAHSARRLFIWDFRYGHRFVDVYRNWGLIGLAAAIFETLAISDPQEWVVCFTIAQPRWFGRDELGGPLREWFADGAEVVGLWHDLRDAIEKAAQPDAPCVTGPHCRDCRAQWDCEANQRAAGAAIDLILDAQPLNMDALAIGLEARTLERAVERAEARLAALDAKALDLIGKGENIPYHRVEFTKPRLVWDKEKQAEAAAICQMFGLDVKLGVALPSPQQCIKAGVDETVITPYTTRAPASKKLVRISDNSAAKVLGRR